MTDITNQWRPAHRTSKALLNAGFSQKQLDTIGKIFVERFRGQSLVDAGSRFTKMVRDSGNAHNLKAKPDTAKDIIKKRAKALENKSEDGAERAQEAKQSNESEAMNKAMAAMVTERFGTSAEEAIKLFGE